MDASKIVNILRATLDPQQRESAEQQLNEVHKIIGFAPTLLQAVMSEQVDMPVRQAGIIYLKNMTSQFWQQRENTNPSEPVPFSIHENDKQPIRDNLVEAVIHAPDPIRIQLTVIVSQIIKHDFPGRWPGIAEKVNLYLSSDNANTWMGALLCLYQLIKNYEYKKVDERGPLTEAMRVLLPLIYQRCLQLCQDESEPSILMQKQVLKCFYAMIQFCLPLDLIDKDAFTLWMHLLGQIVNRAVPEATNQVDEEDRPELAWWKCKKWATHILARIFDRYGSPGNVISEYQQFSEWYLKAFTGPVIQVLLKVLDQYRQKVYVSPRVVLHALNYLELAVSHAFSWKFLKAHMQLLIREVLFPLLCHSDEDDELWNTDPYEYIRTKYDVFEEFLAPTTSAQGLLHTVVSKRKEMLQKTMGFCMQVLTTQDTQPRQKDGALRMIGAMADILLKKKIYKDQVETMLMNYVFPEFLSPHGFLRARACWVLHYFCDVKFKNDENLVKALELTRHCLCNDKDLPVRVEAAIGLQMLITNQDKAKDHIQPHVRPIILELLNIIRETENDDLTTVMQKLVCTFINEVAPIAVEMTQHLAATFAQVLDSDADGSDEKAITAMGILNTLETILNVMEEQKEILTQLEAIVLNVIAMIFQQNLIEFYEEVLSLIYMLTCVQISEHMWQVLGMVYEIFQKDGFDYFTDMMPAIHNYITVDTEGFISNPKNIEMVYSMCKTVLTGEAGEDAECHAAKLLEVILIQYKGQVDQVVGLFVELALERLTREVKTSELRTMCLQVVVSGLYYNSTMMMNILDKMHMPNSTESIMGQFLKQWLHDTDCFLGLHDRKICVLGLCALIDTPAARPQPVNNVAQEILPACLLLFSGLNRAYASRAEGADDDDDDDDDDDEEYEPDELGDDDDDIDDEAAEYLEKLKSNGEGDSDDEDYDDEAEETALESYHTPLDEDDSPVDEYQVFKNILLELQSKDVEWYTTLTAHLTKTQNEEMQDVFTRADQRKAVAESKKIQQGGGYVFQQVTVPQTFNFGGGSMQ